MFRVKALQVAAQRMITVTSVEHVHCTQIVMRVGATALGKSFHTNTYMQNITEFSAELKEASKLVDTQFKRGSQTLTRDATVRRLLYRSQQRGFLELDLIVGRWVTENIHTLNDENLHDLVVVLDQENPDLYRWLTEQESPPADMAANPVYVQLASRTAEFLKANAATASRAVKGAPWSKAWHDSGAQLTPPEPTPPELSVPKGAKWFDTQN